MTDEIEKVNNRIDKVEKAINAIPLIQKDLAAINKAMEKMISITEKQFQLENTINEENIRNDEAHKRLWDQVSQNEKDVLAEKKERKESVKSLWSVWIWIARIVGSSIILALLGLVLVKG